MIARYDWPLLAGSCLSRQAPLGQKLLLEKALILLEIVALEGRVTIKISH